MSALDFPAIAAALDMRGTCTIHLVNPVEQDVERPADRSDGALCVTLSETVGPWSDSPPRAILTATHRASGLCLSSIAGPWLANKEGLRLAKMAAEVLRKAPGINWTLKDPDRGADMKLLIALRELVAVNVPLPKPKRTRKAWPAQHLDLRKAFLDTYPEVREYFDPRIRRIEQAQKGRK